MNEGGSGVQSNSDQDCMGLNHAISYARYVPSLLFHEWFKEASLPALNTTFLCSDPHRGKQCSTLAIQSDLLYLRYKNRKTV